RFAGPCTDTSPRGARRVVRNAMRCVSARWAASVREAAAHSRRSAAIKEGVPMRLTVGALTNNSERLLPDLLRALPAGLAGVESWRLVVVDSGSTDRTVPLARQLAPAATIVELANLGFAALANAAAAADPLADAVLLLSQTARLQPGCAAQLLAA